MKIRHHQPIVICGPSGSGKSTLLKKLLADFQGLFSFTVSHTTRLPRKGELNGREYHFVSQKDMLEMIEGDEFIEHTSFSGNFYGTSKRAVREALQLGKHLIIEVDLEGVRALSSIKELKPVFIFIRPPSKTVLLERLSGRGSESEQNLRLRMERADEELAFADNNPNKFDLVLVNSDLEDTYACLKHFLALSLAGEAKAQSSKSSPTSKAPPGGQENSVILKSQQQQHQIRVVL